MIVDEHCDLVSTTTHEKDQSISYSISGFFSKQPKSLCKVGV